jgi:hypothetical protein
MILPRLLAFITVSVILNAAICVSASSCTNTLDQTPKVSTALALQVELRKQQIATPTDQRLDQMKSMGMILDNLEAQRVFIYMKDMATPEQEEEFKEMGIRITADSWIPPLNDNPLGFYIAQMPFDKLKELAAKDYVVKLDTAEREASSTCGLK